MYEFIVWCYISQVKTAQKAGAAGVIITGMYCTYNQIHVYVCTHYLGVCLVDINHSFLLPDNVEVYNGTQAAPFSMSGDGSTDITTPAVFMQRLDALLLKELLKNEEVFVLLTWLPEDPTPPSKTEPNSMFDDGRTPPP